MNALSQSTLAPSRNASEPASILPHSEGLLKISQVAKLYGVSQCTLRTAHRTVVTLPSGHRRFSSVGIRRWLKAGEIPIEGTGSNAPAGLRVGLMARVSSNQQTQKNSEGESDLSRQVQRLEAWAAATYPAAHITKYVRQASGINLSHPGLLKALRDVMELRLDVLACTFKDRLCRWGIEIIQLVCSLHNVKLIFIEEDSDKTDEEELADDLLNIIHIFSCRKYGKRSAQALKRKPPESVLKEILQWAYRDKLSTYAIVERLKQENKDKDERGRTLSRRIVRRLIAEHKPLADALDNDSSPATSSSLPDFAKAQLRQTINGRRTLDFRKVQRAYKAFCELRSEEPASTRQLLRFIQSRFPTCTITRSEGNGNHVISGLALHNLKDTSALVTKTKDVHFADKQPA